MCVHQGCWRLRTLVAGGAAGGEGGRPGKGAVAPSAVAGGDAGGFAIPGHTCHRAGHHAGGVSAAQKIPSCRQKGASCQLRLWEVGSTSGAGIVPEQLTERSYDVNT